MNNQCSTCRYWQSALRFMGRCRCDTSENYNKTTSRGVTCAWHIPEYRAFFDRLVRVRRVVRGSIR